MTWKLFQEDVSFSASPQLSTPFLHSPQTFRSNTTSVARQKCDCFGDKTTVLYKLFTQSF